LQPVPNCDSSLAVAQRNDELLGCTFEVLGNGVVYEFAKYMRLEEFGPGRPLETEIRPPDYVPVPKPNTTKKHWPIEDLNVLHNVNEPCAKILPLAVLTCPKCNKLPIQRNSPSAIF
jgi:hypothetical protein